MVPKTGDNSNDSLSQNNDATSAGDQQENIWSSILKSVASSKIVPTKSLLILGDRESGKSTLIRHLKGEEDEDVYEAPVTNGNASKSVGTSTDDVSPNQKHSQNDLALSYTFVEVKDDEAEDTLARLGLYQLAGSQEAYQSLLRFALNSTTLPDSLVVIVLDWARPWSFIEALQQWIKFVELGVENIKTEGAGGSNDGWTKGKAIVDEMKDALEHFVRNYDKSDKTVTNGTSEDDEDVVLPLGLGTLTTNLGVPLVVVCTKSDKVCEIDYKEEQFDFIQQSLRTICLKYGAALFYTTTRQPNTFVNLRQYILHRLLGSKAPSSDTKSSYGFNIKPMFVERETVLIPAGWDSWENIKVMSEGFNCDGLLKGWDMDITGKTGMYDGDEEAVSAKKSFDDVVKHVENDKPLSGPAIIEAEDEQEFFARHVETLLKANNERPPSVVGPMSAPQLSYGNFGDIPDLDVITPTQNLPNLPSKPTRTKSTPPTSSPSVQVPNPSPIVQNGPITNTSTTPTTQNEVLANFFQALLTKKGNTTQTSPGSGSSQVSSPVDSASSISVNSKPSSQRKMVEKELANLKISNNTAVSSTAGK